MSSIIYPALTYTVLTELCSHANFAVTQAICEFLFLRDLGSARSLFCVSDRATFRAAGLTSAQLKL